MNYVQNTAGGRCVKDMKDKDTPKVSYFFHFYIWDPEGRRASRSAEEESGGYGTEHSRWEVCER
eukprot:scaffold11996_cov73-Cyclotella_meneghiniana.AAC.7